MAINAIFFTTYCVFAHFDLIEKNNINHRGQNALQCKTLQRKRADD